MAEVVKTPRLRIATELRGARGLWPSDPHAQDFEAVHADWSEESVEKPFQDRIRSRNANRASVREHRRHELEQQLREEFGVPQDSPCSGDSSELPLVAVLTAPATSQSSNSRPGSAAGGMKSASAVKQIGRRPPARPPKPRPYRGIAVTTLAMPAAEDAGEQAVVRWTSSLKSVWPDRLKSEEVTVLPIEEPVVREEATAPDVSSDCTLALVKKEVGSCASISSVAAVQAARREEEMRVLERTKSLESRARRLREDVERMRCRNRRSRLFGVQHCLHEDGPGLGDSSPEEGSRAQYDFDTESESPASARLAPTGIQRQFAEMRKKIEELDELNALEHERLRKQQEEAEARRLEQAEFERSVQEQTEKARQARQERQESAELALKQKHDQELREHEERMQKWRERQRLDADRSKRLEENCMEARSDAATLRWQLLEEELDRQWAEDEATEQRRMQEYASIRRRQYEEWDKKLTSERQRFGLEAEFREAANLHKVQHAAACDEKFYGPQRACTSARSQSGVVPPTPAGRPTSHRPPPPVLPEVVAAEMQGLAPEEQAALKELRSVLGAPREKQKAKVKELLFSWHPDKNPSCPDKAKRVFQFIQKQRQIVLGL